MGSTYSIPAVTMLAGVLVWVAFIVLHEAVGGANERPLWQGVGPCLAAGGLVVFSGVRCRQVGGPRVGHIVRTVLLVAMAAITYWRVDIAAAGVLASAAIVTGALALTRIDRSQAAERSISASAQAGSETD